jgi:hypothetical protein
MMANSLSSKKEHPQIGDIVVSFPNDGTPYQSQIIDIDTEDNTYQLLKDEKGLLSERIFKLDYKAPELDMPRREYKVINLTEFPDRRTGGKMILAELSHVKKTFIRLKDSIECFQNFSLTDPEYYVLSHSSDLAQYIIKNPEETIMICHKMYFMEKDIIINNKKTTAYFTYSPPKEQAFLKRSKYLFSYAE